MSDVATGTTASDSPGVPRGERLRMRELCERTGLNRQTIHFYIRQGLVPAGQKTARNMAWYTAAHVERILCIKKLQHERFLPLHAIKALLDERDDRFDEGQRRFLAGLRARLHLEEASEADGSAEPGRAVPVCRIVASGLADRRDVERLHAAGLSGVGQDADGALVVTGEALPIVALLGQLRRLGFTEERGFTAEDVLIYERMVTGLIREEAQIVARGFRDMAPDEAAERIAEALPLVNELIAALHRAAIDKFLDAF